MHPPGLTGNSSTASGESSPCSESCADPRWGNLANTASTCWSASSSSSPAGFSRHNRGAARADAASTIDGILTDGAPDGRRLWHGDEVVEEGAGVVGVEAVVAAEAAAELAGSEACVGDEVAAVEDRASGVAEA
jgi:hypothetical protein